jgi:hypothetical protein
MKKHTEKLNACIAKMRGANPGRLIGYLEIGVQDPENNFNHIQANTCLGVDPEPVAQPTWGKILQTPSELFWEHNTEQFDFIFIDGKHHAMNTFWDIIQGVCALNTREGDGMVAVHDIYPPAEPAEIRQIPRPESRRRRPWCGNAWQAYWLAKVLLQNFSHNRVYPFRMTHYVDFDDYGIGFLIILKGTKDLKKLLLPEFDQYIEIHNAY